MTHLLLLAWRNMGKLYSIYRPNMAFNWPPRERLWRYNSPRWICKEERRLIIYPRRPPFLLCSPFFHLGSKWLIHTAWQLLLSGLWRLSKQRPSDQECFHKLVSYTWRYRDVRGVVIWMRLEGMNRCIVSRLLDQFLVARIDPEPCACVQLACACLKTSRAALAWSSTLLLGSSRVSWIKIDFANFPSLTSQSALVSASASISSVGQ